MKKVFTLLMICMFALMTGCGDSQTNEQPVTKDELKLGMIRHLNITETLLDNYFEKSAPRMAQTSVMRAPKHIFFDNTATMIAALKSGQIDEISTYECVGKYLIAQNTNFELATDVPKISDSFCCALRQDDTSLKTELDAAIKKLTDDGMLAKLTKTYITDADYSAQPTAVTMPKFDGALTVKVGVTGDLPPLDFVTADDKAAGFNTAMLAEISKLVGKNFELVNVDGGARAAALNSELVDVIFWVAVPSKNSFLPPDCDKPEGAILTEPYFTNDIVHVKLKK